MVAMIDDYSADWLVPGLLEQRELYIETSHPDEGRDRLMLEVAACLAARRPVRGIPARRDRERVTYVDSATDEPDSVAFLRGLGIPQRELAMMRHLTSEHVGRLDGHGATKLLGLANGSSLVVLDGLSRLVEGDGGAETFRALHRLVLAPLTKVSTVVVLNRAPAPQRHVGSHEAVDWLGELLDTLGGTVEVRRARELGAIAGYTLRQIRDAAAELRVHHRDGEGLGLWSGRCYSQPLDVPPELAHVMPLLTEVLPGEAMALHPVAAERDDGWMPLPAASGRRSA